LAVLFTSQDFYNINEIADFSEDRLRGEEFGLLAGNAQFLLKAVKGEMKRVCGRKRARLN
jgi:hypothetical protein